VGATSTRLRYCFLIRKTEEKGTKEGGREGRREGGKKQETKCSFI
jgi:hypothetical protein